MLKRSNLLSVWAFALIALVLSVAGCSKKDSPAYSGQPTITGISATQFHPGDTVHVSGKGLTNQPYTIQLFDSLSINVLQSTDTSIIFVLPAATHFGFYGAASGQLLIQNAAANQTWTVTISVPEPHGWFAQAGMNYLKPEGFPQQSIHLYFPSDSVGYLQHVNGILRTADGGDSWQTPGNAYGNSFGLAVVDNNDLFSYGISNVSASTNGSTSWTPETLPSALAGTVLSGMAMFSPSTGVLMSENGLFYTLAGTWDTTSATGLIKEYQSTGPVGNTGFSALSAVDLGDLLAGGIVHSNSTTYQSDVVAKTNGVYDEYTLSTSVSSSGFLTIQLLTPSLGFALDGYNHLLKYTGNRNWSVLSSQTATAVFFLDANNGYIGSGHAIYQTTDGGQTWNSVFNLQTNQVMYNFAAHNGHIWGVGSDTAAGKGFIVKYNP